jgi:hypothetical protein
MPTYHKKWRRGYFRFWVWSPRLKIELTGYFIIISFLHLTLQIPVKWSFLERIPKERYYIYTTANHWASVDTTRLQWGVGWNGSSLDIFIYPLNFTYIFPRWFTVWYHQYLTLKEA